MGLAATFFDQLQEERLRSQILEMRCQQLADALRLCRDVLANSMAITECLGVNKQLKKEQAAYEAADSALKGPTR